MCETARKEPTLGYFAPPSAENWRMVDVSSSAHRLRVDWLPPNTLATTWKVAVTSVISKREQAGAPDLREAIAVGLLPPWSDGEIIIDTKLLVSGNHFVVCRGRGNHAYPDFTAIIRMRIDDPLLVGMTVRVRPACSPEDANDLLNWMGRAIEEWSEEPVPSTSPPPTGAPILRELDEAMERDDHERALEIIEELRPRLLDAPLSRFALNLHVTEGWVEKRRAFSGEEAAATRAIDILRAVIDSIDAARHPDLLRVASLWLAQSYSKRDAANDLARALLAYGTVIRLARPDVHRATMYFQSGVLHRALAERAKDKPDDATAHARLAFEQFDLARQLFEASNAAAGLIEVAVARADTVRLLGGDSEADRAATLYNEAWSLIHERDGQQALGPERFRSVLEHIVRCMRVLDVKQFGSEPTSAPDALRAVAVFLRPLTLTRRLKLHRPGDATGAVSLEFALAHTLSPEVRFSYVGGAMHPLAASMISTASPDADWKVAAELQVNSGDLVILVPGYTPGMQWELRFLIEERKLDRTLMIMLPAEVADEAASLWEGARGGALTFGVELPSYDASGCFLRLSNDGKVLRRLPFEALWSKHELLGALSDLLRAPEEIRERYAKERAEHPHAWAER